LPLRHVVIFSDGKSLPGDVEALAARYRDAGVTLSAVATGTDADRRVLSELAQGAGGRFYAASDIRELPDVFLDDLRRIEGPLVRTGTLALEAGEPGDVLAGVDLATLPTVAGYNRVRERERVLVELRHTVGDTPEPVLATRRVGLGRSAALTVSFDPAWTGGFLDWSGWTRTLANLVDATRRTQSFDTWELDVHREGGRFRVRATRNETPPDDGTPALAVRLSPSDGPPTELPLTRTGARTWEGERDTDIEEVVTAALVETAGPSPGVLAVRYVAASYPAEYHRLTPRTDLLERIARVTGGRVVENIDAFRAAAGDAPRRLADVTPWLALLALFAFLAEIVTRAIGWV
ncbi:MAG TPA: VWA domain-containing protein, partial [Planctomycetota bacterium]|nr:VWA domain-containing protein [Planctomycetota bacterium]